MQGIQIAKEMAQQELSSQKAAYESKIQALEAELVSTLQTFPLGVSQSGEGLSDSLQRGLSW